MQRDEQRNMHLAAAKGFGEHMHRSHSSAIQFAMEFPRGPFVPRDDGMAGFGALSGKSSPPPSSSSQQQQQQNGNTDERTARQKANPSTGVHFECYRRDAVLTFAEDLRASATQYLSGEKPSYQFHQRTIPSFSHYEHIFTHLAALDRVKWWFYGYEQFFQ